MKHNTLTFISIFLTLLVLSFKVVVKIESCAASGRCRVEYNDGTLDLLLDPYVGQKVYKAQ